jgi:hypothetical protein
VWQFGMQCSAGTLTYKAAASGAGNAVALAESTGLPAGILAVFLVFLHIDFSPAFCRSVCVDVCVWMLSVEELSRGCDEFP